MAEHHVGQGTLMNGGQASFTQTFNNNHCSTAPHRTLLKALRFPARGLREQMVEQEARGTCEWFLKTSEYRNWTKSEYGKDHGQRMLWILGKAGSGKSTLLKFVIRQARAHATRSDLLLTHFFNARGGVLEKSVEGMYRTILVQIIEKMEHLSAALLEDIGGWMPSEASPWPVPTLVALLKAAIRMLEERKLIFFIDALDECDSEQAQEMVESFESLIEEAASNRQRFLVCFASRPYPHIATDYAEYIRLDLSESHEDDIKEYIKTNLRIGQSPAQHAVRRREQIKEQLLVKSKHVFLWAKLVVALLNKEYRSGRPERYDRWLEGSLGDLENLYAEIWHQSNGLDDEQEVRAWVLCFLWALYHSDRVLGPWLSARDLWWGIQFGLGEYMGGMDQMSRELDDATLQRFITSTSKGFIEVHDINMSEEPLEWDAGRKRSLQVSFIHESAREFILSDRGPLMRLGWFADWEDVELRAHLQLKACCEARLEDCRLDLIMRLESIETADGEASRTSICQYASAFDFLPYACLSIFEHANIIQGLQSGDYDQAEWLASFYARFDKISSLFTHRVGDDGKVPLFSLLAGQALFALMQSSWDLLSKEARDAQDSCHVPGISEYQGKHLTIVPVLVFRPVAVIGMIIEIYLTLARRHKLVQMTLTALGSQALANNWDHGGSTWLDDAAREQPEFLVASFSDPLATFFLIALIPSVVSFSDDEAEALQLAASKGYICALNHLIRSSIPTRFLDSTRWITGAFEEWAMQRPEVELAATLAALRKGEISYKGFEPGKSS